MAEGFRPLDEEQRLAFLTALGLGASITYAARQAGTSKARIGKIVSVAREAEGRVLEGKTEFDELTDNEVWAIQFLVSMEQGSGGLEQRLVDSIITAAEDKGKWQAAAWLLERLNPTRFAAKPADRGLPPTPAGGIGGPPALDPAAEIAAAANRILEAAGRGAAEIAAAAQESIIEVNSTELSDIDPALAHRIEEATVDFDDPDLGF